MTKKTKYILYLILCGFIGGCIGFSASYFDEFVNYKFELSGIYEGFFFGGALIQGGLIVLSFILYFRARNVLNKMEADVDEVLEQKANQLSNIGCILATSTVIVGLSVAPFITQLSENVITMVAVFIFGISMLLSVVASALIFGLIKKTNPEKNVSFYDKKADKKLVSQMDEAEKQIAGSAAFITQLIMKKVFSSVMFMVFISSLIVPELVVVNIFIGSIWIMQTIVFAIKVQQIEGGRNK